MILILLFSCAKEDDAPKGKFLNSDGQKAVFYATMEGFSSGNQGTKVYADEDLKLLWNEDDCISVFYRTTFNQQYMFTGEDGDNAGGFEEIPISSFATANAIESIYAVYPYSKDNRVNNDGDLITVVLPQKQVYKEGSFGVGANTMVAITDNNFLSFKNVCGYLKLRLYGDNQTISSVSIEGNNGEKIAGKAFVSIHAGETPSTNMDDSGTETITINCPVAVTLGSSKTDCTEFIFVIPPTTFPNGFSIKVTNTNGAVFEKSTSNTLTISRNKMESMGALKVVPNNFDDITIDIPDAEFRRICLNNYDKNKDGKISASEVANVYSLTISSNSNIQSLEGIQYFKSLGSLTCENNNNLTYLDLSNNTNLTTVKCGNNKLTYLNVSGCDKLETLQCHYNYELEELVLGNHPAMTILHCHGNKLTSIDVSSCVALDNFACGENQLTSLDISSLTAMTKLSCNNNQLSSLNLNSNTKLTTLNCGYNPLGVLDVSKNTDLTQISCYGCQLSYIDLSHNKKLKSLYIDDNDLTEIDVSNNLVLDYFSCGNNNLSQIDISNNLNIYGLICHNNLLSSLDLSNHRALGTLWCFNNNLTSIDVSTCPVLSEIMCYGNNITSLDISHNGLLSRLMAWDTDENTLETIWIKKGAKISYINRWYSTIKPEDFGIEIIEVEP